MYFWMAVTNFARPKNPTMKRKIEFAPVNLQGVADIYSIRIDGDKEYEFQKFMLLFKPDKNKPAEDKSTQEVLFEDDYFKIIEGINEISLKGALERFFRNEGKLKDRVYAVPLDIQRRDKTKYGTLRVYCLRISDKLLIIGSGGKKMVDAYQEDADLDKAVKTLQAIDKELYIREMDGMIIENEIQNLTIYID